MERKNLTSIRDKLTAFASEILLISMGALIGLGLILGISDFSEKSTQAAESVRANLIGKGKLLVANNSLALRGMAADNAFLAVRELIRATVQTDTDLVYGIFMDAERRPWVYATQDNPEGIAGNTDALDDEGARWAHGAHLPEWREKAAPSGRVIEFTAPVVMDSVKLGTIRYGLSTSAIDRAISATRREVFLRSLTFPAVFLVVGLLLYLILSRQARRHARAITDPISNLTRAAQTISEGDYETEISDTSNDEIGLLAGAFNKMRETVRQYTENLESMVAERTNQLRAAQQELIEKAHRAGMADIATGTLHNVGNILNSVRVSVDVLFEALNRTPLAGFSKANALLREHIDHFDEFIRSDPRGPKLLQYYFKLEEGMHDECEVIRQAGLRLGEKVAAICEVIAAQQSYAGAGGLVEEISLTAIIEDALTMQTGSIEKYGVRVIRQFEEVGRVRAQKTKLMHVLINLINNAKEAMMDTEPEKRCLSISIRQVDTSVIARFSDAGQGISRENLTRIFNHGFTTKKQGHGFGLHSSANYMKEMNAELWAESAGPGTGAAFVLKFPLPVR